MSERDFWMLVYRCLVSMADAVARYQCFGKYATPRKEVIQPADSIGG